MTQIKSKKRRLVKKSDPDNTINPEEETPSVPEEESQIPDSNSPESIQTLLEACTKDQLINLLVDAALNNPSVSSRIYELADRDISHRKIFVHGLGWDASRESLLSAFEPNGEIEDCKVVTDKITGKAKGFGFVIFKSRQGATRALKEPKKMIGNRMVSCQLASVGPVSVSETASRKIYVSDVPREADSMTLREFFERFGEIEAGPLGFDVQTGRSRGYALFVYKNLDGVKRVLAEPDKMFDGHQLHCRMAADGKNGKNSKGDNSNNNASVTTVVQPVQPQLLAAWAAAQNMALLGQQQGLNPVMGMNSMFGLANPNAGLLNPLLGAGVIGANQVGQMGMGLGSYGGPLAGQASFGGSQSVGGSQSLLGAYSGGSNAGPVLQGLQHAYPGSQMGQASTSKSGGPFGGF